MTFDHPYTLSLRRHIVPYFRRWDAKQGCPLDFLGRAFPILDPARRHPAPPPPPTSWNLRDLCAAYQWPTNARGGGTIAIIELGGGWHQQDVAQFCSANSIPVPSITDVSVDGSINRPGDPADAEVALDIQIAAAAYSIATGGDAAKIRMYWAQDITLAIQAATKDGCDVCSISWGANERAWGVALAQALDAAASAAVAAGMVVFAASGDNDSSDGTRDSTRVDLPAAAPHVIGCGGTNKPHAGAETVWNNNPGKANGSGTGGGYSSIFPPQSWQVGAPVQNTGGRLVPDIAANADPQTGYEVFISGRSQIVGGTSAVAPLYAGLFAAFGTKLGFITPKLYGNAPSFHDITQGDNGAYHAGPGVDACTGLGSPIGAHLAITFGAVWA
jgi:kumamolisin